MIRTATPQDLSLMLDWAADEGWNPGLDDAEAFMAADPGGFFVDLRDGGPVACISVVNHSDSFAFLGFYICRPEWRGRGIGLQLWTEALKHAGDRCVGLDGVADQQANYARSGFVHAGATRRFEGALAALPMAGDATPHDDPEALIALDRQAFGIDRPRYMRAWFQDTPRRKTLVHAGSGGVTALATARQCRAGCKVGPVIAPDTETALRLAACAAASVGGSRVIIDVPDSQPEMQARLTAADFVETFGTARMYRGKAPQASPLGRAVATLELG